jgi:hypothetical protein
MADTHVILTGNLTDDPHLRYTPTARRWPTSAWPSPQGSRTVTPGGTGRPRLPRQRVAAAGRARRRVPHQGRPGGGHRPPQVAVLGDPEGDKRSVVPVEAKLLVGGAGQPDTSLCEACEYRRYLAATGGRDLANEERAAGASCPSPARAALASFGLPDPTPGCR